MYYKITDGSFTYEDADGNEQTVTGSLAILAPSDQDVMSNGDTQLGNVVFITAPADDGEDDTPTPTPTRKAGAKRK